MAFKPGQSGNPKGRPAGQTLSDRLRKAVGREFDAILSGIIEAAKGGDTQAASLLLSRTCPPLKTIQEAVKVPLSGDTLTAKAASILDAVAAGALSVADGKELLTALAAIAKIQEVDELTKRIEALEAKQ